MYYRNVTIYRIACSPIFKLITFLGGRIIRLTNYQVGELLEAGLPDYHYTIVEGDLINPSRSQFNHPVVWLEGFHMSDTCTCLPIHPHCLR